LISSINNIFIASFDVIALPIYIRETFHTSEFSGAEVYGFTLSSMAIGALLSAVWMGRQKKLPRRGILYYSLIGATGTAVFLLTLTNSIITTLLITTIIGF